MASLHYRKDRKYYKIAMSLFGKRFWISVKTADKKRALKILDKMKRAESEMRDALKEIALENYLTDITGSKFSKKERHEIAIKLLSKIGEKTV